MTTEFDHLHGMNEDDDGPEPSVRDTLARIPRPGAGVGRQLGASGKAGRVHTYDREVPELVRDPVAAAGLTDLLQGAAAGHPPTRSDVEDVSAGLHPDLSRRERSAWEQRLRSAAAAAAELHRDGALADARHAAKVSAGELAPDLVRLERDDPDRNLTGREIAARIPR